MILALFRYFTVCLEPASKINQRLKQTADMKMTIGIIISTVVPTAAWTSLMFFSDSVTGKAWYFKKLNTTNEIVAFQDVAEEERDKSGTVIALNLISAIQLITTFLLYGGIVYKSYMSTLSTVLKIPEAENKKVEGEST